MFSWRILSAVLLVCLPTLLVAADIEGVGRELGYRLYGEAKKNKAIVVQNSRGKVVEVFNAGRGNFVPIPAYSDAELECRGHERSLRVRFRDSFRESVPFQVVVPCGRELQFVEPERIAAPRPSVTTVVEPSATSAPDGEPRAAASTEAPSAE